MESLREGYPDCNVEFRIGDPAEQVTQLARETNADLIITASHHPGFLGRLFWVGSSAEDLASRRLSGSRLSRGRRVKAWRYPQLEKGTERVPGFIENRGRE